MKKLIFDGGREYVKRVAELDAGGINTSPTANCLPKENVCSERMSCTNKNAVRAMINLSDTPATCYAECLYVICEARRPVARVKGSMIPQELPIGVKLAVVHLRMFECNVCV